MPLKELVAPDFASKAVRDRLHWLPTAEVYVDTIQPCGDTLVGHSYGTVLWDTLVDTLVEHSNWVAANVGHLGVEM